MKKSIVYIAFTLILAFALCACGADRTSDGTVDGTAGTAKATNTPMVTVSPMITPDTDNGIVEDKDGIIEEEDSVLPSTAVSDNAGTNAGTNASPNVSASPSATVKP